MTTTEVDFIFSCYLSSIGKIKGRQDEYTEDEVSRFSFFSKGDYTHL